MKNNYDNIANAYDFLSRLVFGKAQVKIQLDLLKFIPPNSRILIVGGGSGWILEKLAERYTNGLEITYVEISANMLNLSKKRDYKQNKVVFMQTAIESFCAPDETYEVIITSFLFDNFSEQRAEDVFDLLNRLLTSSGSWLYSDFYLDPSKKEQWKKWMLAMMYRFFRLICHVEANTLVNMEKYFEAAKYRLYYQALTYHGFIKGMVYKKLS